MSSHQPNHLLPVYSASYISSSISHTHSQIVALYMSASLSRSIPKSITHCRRPRILSARTCGCLPNLPIKLVPAHMSPLSMLQHQLSPHSGVTCVATLTLPVVLFYPETYLNISKCLLCFSTWNTAWNTAITEGENRVILHWSFPFRWGHRSSHGLFEIIDKRVPN